MAKGRKPVSANPVTMQTEIYRIESENTFAKRGDLFAALFKSDWNQNAAVPMAEGTIPAKFAAWGLECSTPPGKRGGEVGDFGRSKGIKPGGSRRKRGMSPEAVAKFWDNAPERAKTERLAKILERAEAGQTRALVAVTCIDCCNFAYSEIRRCTSNDCGIHSIRPYQGKAVLPDDGDETPREELICQMV